MFVMLFTKSVFQTAEELLRGIGCHFNPSVLARMHQRFGSRVLAALVTRDPHLLRDVYLSADALPSTATINSLAETGFILDGNLVRGNDDIIIAIRTTDGLPFAMKICSELEYVNTRAWLAACAQSPDVCHHIIPIILYSSESDRRPTYLEFMPLHPSTLECYPLLIGTTLNRFFAQMVTALNYCHQLGFIHNDVKPSNILVSTSGDFILADLGSITPPGLRSSSTQAYVPDDMWDRINHRTLNPACVAIDWWMLAVTLYEKAFGGNVGEGVRELNREELWRRLSGQGGLTGLPLNIVSQLKELLEIQ